MQLTLAELVIDNFQMILRMKPNSIHSGGYFDNPVTHRHMNAFYAFLGYDENILPILEFFRSLPKLDQSSTKAAHSLREGYRLIGLPFRQKFVREALQ